MITEVGHDVLHAAKLLKEGKLVAIPTETVYGLAANATDSAAVASIFEVKNRPFFDPLIVHVPSVESAKNWTGEIPAPMRLLMERFWPGPLTFILKKNHGIPDIVSAGLDTIGIRVPDKPLVLKLLRNLPFPLAAPSANPFGYVSPTRADHVLSGIGGKIPYILDDGPCSVGVESTIVSMEDACIYVLRKGGLPIEEIEAALPGYQIIVRDSSSNPTAPGMFEKHYATIKPLNVGDVESLLKLNRGKKIGVISFSKNYSGLNTISRPLSENKNLNEAASRLFIEMRQLDDSDVDLIVAERFPEIGLGRAINDRLMRAENR